MKPHNSPNSPLSPTPHCATHFCAAPAEALNQVRVWLEALGESDPATVAEALDLCANDAATRAYYVQRAAEPLSDHTPADAGDLAHGDEVARLVDAGWCWHGGRWWGPGAWKAEPAPDRYLSRANEPLPDHREAPGESEPVVTADEVLDLCRADGEPSPRPDDRDISGDIRQASPTRIRCGDCGHASPVEWHQALVSCRAGRDSGNPTRLFWATDLRTCSLFKNDGGAT
jgi:hypothetical protein